MGVWQEKGKCRRYKGCWAQSHKAHVMLLFFVQNWGGVSRRKSVRVSKRLWVIAWWHKSWTRKGKQSLIPRHSSRITLHLRLIGNRSAAPEITFGGGGAQNTTNTLVSTSYFHSCTLISMKLNQNPYSNSRT